MPGGTPFDLGHPEFRAAWHTDRDGAVILRPEARAVLYSHSPPNLAELAAQHWRPMRSRVPEAPITDPAWTSVPCTYVVCTKDRTIRVEAQRKYAAQATENVEIDCDHSPFFSALDRLTAILAEQATRAVQAARS